MQPFDRDLGRVEPETVRLHLPAGEPSPTAPVDRSRGEVHRVVRGRVSQGEAGAADLTVVLSRPAVRREVEVGRATSDADGGFVIAYGDGAGDGAGMVLRAYRGADVVAEFSFLANGEKERVVDLVIADGAAASEYDRYLARLGPSLNGTALTDLADHEVDVLARDSGVPRDAVTALVQAARVEATQPDGVARVPAAAYYAWARDGVPIETVWNRSPVELAGALDAAVARGIVPPSAAVDVPAVHTGQKGADLLRRPRVPGRAAALADVLATMPAALPPARQVDVAAVIDQRPATDEELHRRLEATGIGRAEAVAVVRTVRLADLTLDHTALMRPLQDWLARETEPSLRPLAGVTPDRWLDLAYAHGAPAGSDLGVPAYAAHLTLAMERAHPVATLAAQLQTGSVRVARPGFDRLPAFLAANPRADIVGTPGRGLTDDPELGAALDALRGLRALGATWRESAVFINAGADTPRRIAELGRRRLHRAVGGHVPDDRAGAIWAAASAAHDTALGVVSLAMETNGKWARLEGALKGSVMKVDVDGVPPTLRGLFGDPDHCACDGCSSVLSPAAYLVDLLEFVKPDPAARAALMEHRPDLVDLELSCENTRIELPYVDLVLEVLENAVALPLPIPLAPGANPVGVLSAAVAATRTAGRAPVPAVIAEALAATTVDVPEQAAFGYGGAVAAATDEWTVADERRRWSLSSWSGGFMFGHGPRRPEREVPFRMADAPALIAQLDAGQLSAPFRATLEASLRDRHPSDHALGVGSVSITPVAPGRVWRLRYSLMVQVEILKGQGIAVTTPGSPTFTVAYGQGGLDVTEHFLENGLIGGVLPPVLGTGRDLTVHAEPVTADSAVRRWTVVGEDHEIDLLFQTDQLTITALTYQSVAGDADLVAVPRNRNPTAYRALRRAEYPWTLPFDLPLAETRAFLDALGQPRSRLRELVTPPAQRDGDDALAREILGLSPATARLITEPATDDALWSRWGLADAGGPTSLRDAATEQWFTGSALSLLSRVSLLLQQSGLTLDEVRDVLDTRYVAAAGVVLDPPTECAASRMTARGLTEAHLDRIHRFTRLRRALGWSVPELDLLIAAIQPDAAAGPAQGRALLRGLARAAVLHRRLRVPLATLAAWWGGLDTRVVVAHTAAGQPDIPSPYDRLFRSPLQAQPVDPAFALRADRSALALAGVSISDKAEVIAAALSARQDDIRALAGTEVPDEITLPGLAALHRAVTLARALRITVAEYLTLRRLTRVDPGAGPAATAEFVAAAEAVRDARITLPELAYLLRHERPAGEVSVLTADQATALLIALRTRARAAHTGALGSPTDPVAALRALLARAGWPASDVDTFVAALGRDPRDPVAGPGSVSLLVALGRSVGLPGQALPPEPLLSPGGAAALLGADDDPVVRAAALVDRLARREAALATVAALAAVLGVSEAVAVALSTQRVSDGARTSALAVLTAPEFVDSDPTAVPDPATRRTAYAVLERLHKAALVTRRLGLTADLLRALPGLAVLDLDRLPVASPEATAPNLMPAFLALARLVAAAGRRGSGGPGIVATYADTFGATPTDPTAARAALAVAFGLTPDVVGDAAAALRVGTADEHRDADNVARLLDLLAELRRTGATPDQLASLVAADPDDERAEAAARLARQLLRGQRSDEQWRDQLRPIADGLRERQRDALVDFLVARDGLRDATDLYDRYLIDVEMAPCMTSTRILQAIAAVQLFVHRCLLRQEPAAPPQSVDVDRWEWMKNYRVWEANRKVFLYPENWLFPELRDDKTQTFAALEGDLGQQESGFESGRSALVAYVDELSELAQVLVVGSYTDEVVHEGASQRVLYAVGRSPNRPYQYFWRRCDDLGGAEMCWSGWERIEFDIPGDHILPFVFEGDLHIAWPIFRTEGQAPKTRYLVQMAWARRTARGWSKRKLSRDTLDAATIPNRDERTMFAFRVTRGPGAPGDIVLRCYVTRRDARLDVVPDLTEVTSTLRDMTEPEPFGFGTLVYEVSLAVRAYLKYDPAGYADADVTIEAQWFKQRRAGTLERSTTEWNYLPDLTRLRGGWWVLDVAAQSGGPIFELALRVNYRRPDGTVTTKPLEPIKLIHFKVIRAVRVAVFDAPTTPELANPEMALPMEALGEFTYSSGRDVAFARATGPDLYQPPGTYSWSSGFRETGDQGARKAVEVGYTVIGDSHPNEQYLTVPGQPTPAPFAANRQVWALAEGGRRMYADVNNTPIGRELTVYPDAYPEVGGYRRTVALDIGGLFRPDSQLTTFGADQLDTYLTNSQAILTDDPRPAAPAPSDIGFLLRMPYSTYHWELFVHAPLRIAAEQARQRCHDDALRTLRFVFDPTTDETVDPANPAGRYWTALPLRRAARPARIADLIASMLDPADNSPEKRDFIDQVERWRRHPFRPHAVARMRHGAYQWHALFTFCDVMIASADDLYQRDTREAIAEATQRYLLVARVLGPRPRASNRRRADSLSYRELTQRAAGAVDDIVVFLAPGSAAGGNATAGPTGYPGALMSLGSSYFCVPHNEKLDRYWDTLADRLFKIRHCQNIEGVTRALALWDPPIDPEILVRAVAAGVDIGSVLADRDAPVGPYRFTVLAQKAAELCGEVRALGAALLNAMERRDGEELARLRSAHETELLTRMRTIRVQHITEAQEQLAALRGTRGIVGERFVQYQRLIGHADAVAPPEGTAAPIEGSAMGGGPGLGLSTRETEQLNRMKEAQGLGLAAGILNMVGGAFFAASAPFGNDATKAVFNGLQAAAHASNAISSGLGALGGYLAAQGSQDGLLASYERRRHDWAMHSNQAARELVQLDRQIAAGEIRVEMATVELANHERQLAQSAAIGDFLRDKFTNSELYDWHVDALSGIYHGTFQLALDLTKRAERAYRSEIGHASRFVGFGHWDAARHGLLAGELLQHDLRRLEVAYLEQNRRELEIVRHVSLRQLDPAALIQLKETGDSGEFEVPEWLFDLDFPGHFRRRLKSVSLSVPCVVGPYTGVNATLTLLRSSVRDDPTAAGAAGYPRADDDDRFTDFRTGPQSIAVSGGQSDAGLFEPNLRDERLLPFEGHGAISTWRVSLPRRRGFDYHTISDVVLHLMYTARSGGDAFAGTVSDALDLMLTDVGGAALRRLVSLRHEFPAEWVRFVSPATATGDQELTFDVADRFPLMFSGAGSTITVNGADVYVQAVGGSGAPGGSGALGDELRVVLTHPADVDPEPLTLSTVEGLQVGGVTGINVAPGGWTLRLWREVVSASGPVHQRLTAAEIKEVLVVFHYTVAATP
jgi:hypothetical protein